MRRHLVGSVCALGLMVTGCAGGSESAGPTTTTTIERTVTTTVTAGAAAPKKTTAAPSSSAAAPNDLRKPIDNFGAIVTVKRVKAAKSIRLEGRTRAAQSGGRFVIVQTVVRNKTKQSMDLTCSLPILTKLVDTDGTEYDTIDNLYKIPGNPECNASLNPGFSDKMTWIFEVPAGVDVAGMSILESNTYRPSEDATLIQFGL